MEDRMMKRKHLQFAAAVAAALISSPALAQPATWNIDTAHSSAQFSVRHMMVETVRGEFASTKGTVRWDGKDLATAVVEATIDASTISTREPKRDAHLKSADFFDVEKFPTLMFRSTRVEPVAPGKLRMTGSLTMHGVTRPVVFDVEGPTQAIKDNRGNQRVGASATATISRKDFGLTWNAALEAGGVVVSDEVKITLDVALMQPPDGAGKH
jgi:polyisoprenoid-binding protein YceI